MKKLPNSLLGMVFLLFMGAGIAQGKDLAPFKPPSIPEIKKLGYNPEICPICGRNRRVCNEIYNRFLEGKPLPKGVKVCAVHTKIGIIKTMPVFCPICGYKVDVPLVPMKTQNTDSDLCPHPTGQVRFRTNIPICPNCGFAANRKQFRSRDPRYFTPAIKAWVRRILTPAMREAQWQLLTGTLSGIRRSGNFVFIPTGIKKADGRPEVKRVAIASLFDKQETIPDTIRVRHAYAYYTMLKADSAKRAQLAWQTAWAYRREVSGTLSGAQIMSSIERILKACEEDKVHLQEEQGKVRIMAKMYLDKRRFSYLDREVIGIMLAGHYDRLGYPTWARRCLRQAAQDAYVENTGKPKAWPVGKPNPWRTGLSGSQQEINKNSRQRRQAIATIAALRLMMLNQEEKYLSLAAQLIREGLKQHLYPTKQLPSFIYLVGEFERRREAFPRARVWLQSAQAMLGEEIAIENFAPQQIEYLQAYAKQVRNQVPYSRTERDQDGQLLTSLRLQIERAGTLRQGLRAQRGPNSNPAIK